MESAHDMQLGNAKSQRLARLLHNFLYAVLKAIRVALLACERAELATEDAVVGIVDVAIDDVAGAIADLPLTRLISDRPHGIEVFAFKQTEGVAFRYALAGSHFFVDVPQLAALNKKMH